MKVAVSFVPIVIACGPVVAVEQGSTTEGSTESTTTSSPSSTSTSTPTTTTTTTTTTTDTTSPTEPTSDPTFSFVADDDGTSFDSSSFVIPDIPPGVCDIWMQNCPEGFKCSPISLFGETWDGAWCTPIADEPKQPGEPCTMEGSSMSGIDDCALGSTCFYVDGQALQGTCVALCQGSHSNPVCEDASTACSITHQGALILCLPRCDPLAHDCGDGRVCVFVDEVAVCWTSAAPEGGGDYGDPCMYINGCNDGLFCGAPKFVPGCGAGPDGCCSPYCDLDEPACPDEDLGVECIPWFENPPPEHADLGACAIPP